LSVQAASPQRHQHQGRHRDNHVHCKRVSSTDVTTRAHCSLSPSHQSGHKRGGSMGLARLTGRLKPLIWVCRTCRNRPDWNRNSMARLLKTLNDRLRLCRKDAAIGPARCRNAYSPYPLSNINSLKLSHVQLRCRRYAASYGSSRLQNKRGYLLI
jgi:hypothetical protein